MSWVPLIVISDKLKTYITDLYLKKIAESYEDFGLLTN